jgi:hypothetical protein
VYTALVHLNTSTCGSCIIIAPWSSCAALIAVLLVLCCCCSKVLTLQNPPAAKLTPHEFWQHGCEGGARQFRRVISRWSAGSLHVLKPRHVLFSHPERMRVKGWHQQCMQVRHGDATWFPSDMGPEEPRWHPRRTWVRRPCAHLARAPHVCANICADISSPAHLDDPVPLVKVVANQHDSMAFLVRSLGP